MKIILVIVIVIVLKIDSERSSNYLLNSGYHIYNNISETDQLGYEDNNYNMNNSYVNMNNN